ncbi:MAG TPA: TMEM175 family protein [Burkholderiales bacterium]|nr:TMEM175 family protein [Burkholderiales bacterium]
MTNHPESKIQAAMTKTRLEAFSDGVFAIVITLLILEIKLPEVGYDELPHALIEALPRIAAYVMSFAIIGLYWITHHRSSELIVKVDGAILWLNLLLLLLVSFLPFPTALLGRYPYEPLPILIYGANLLACNAVGFGMLSYVLHHRHLVEPGHGMERLRKQYPSYIIVNSAYLLAVILASYAPVASYAILALTLVALIVRIVKYDP